MYSSKLLDASVEELEVEIEDIDITLEQLREEIEELDRQMDELAKVRNEKDMKTRVLRSISSNISDLIREKQKEEAQ